jgi:hypothetical protein
MIVVRDGNGDIFYRVIGSRRQKDQLINGASRSVRISCLFRSSCRNSFSNKNRKVFIAVLF